MDNVVAACWRCNNSRHRRKHASTQENHRKAVQRRLARQRWHPAWVRSLALPPGQARDEDVTRFSHLQLRQNETTDKPHREGPAPMKATAKNQFVGKITEAISGPVTCTIRIKSDTGEEVTGTVNRAIFDELGCREGQEAVALVKASSVILVMDTGGYRFSASNQFTGKVTSVDVDSAMGGAIVELPSGREIAASVSRGAASTLTLREGMEATVMFKSYSVILGVR